MEICSKRFIFTKMTKVLKGRNSKYFWKMNEINKYMKIYNFEDHFKSIVYLQFSSADCLWDLTTKFKDNLKVKKFLKILSYLQLSRLSKEDKVSVFSEIFFCGLNNISQKNCIGYTLEPISIKIYCQVKKI